MRAYCSDMAKADPDRLAAALRENLRKRKEQARAHVVQPSFGTDEEGDAPVPDNGDKPGAWVREGSGKD